MANLKASMYHNAEVAKGTKRDNDTAKTYKNGIRKFVTYMQETYGINQIRDVYDKKVIYAQEFSDWLTAEGYSSSTVKTYVAGVCQGLRMSMSDVKRNKVGAPTKGRNADANKQGQREEKSARYATSVELSKATGLRRRELRKLTLDSLKVDESGHWCVEVKKGDGKGGKGQLQRILPQNVDTVRAIYDNAKKSYEAAGYKNVGKQPVLAPDQTKNKINYHSFRRINAQDVVTYYTDIVSSQEGRKILVDEIVARWNKCHSESPKKDRHGKERVNEKIIKDAETGMYVPADSRSPARKFLEDLYRTGTYKLRGENLSRAINQGRPVEYDRVALLAISVFHLSHWRNDVTVKNYILS